MSGNEFTFEANLLANGYEVKLAGVPEAFGLLRHAHTLLELEREDRIIVDSGEVPPLHAPPSDLWRRLNTAAQTYDVTDMDVSLGAVDFLHRGTRLAANELRRRILLSHLPDGSEDHRDLGKYTLLATRLKPHVRVP